MLQSLQGPSKIWGSHMFRTMTTSLEACRAGGSLQVDTGNLLTARRWDTLEKAEARCRHKVQVGACACIVVIALCYQSDTHEQVQITSVRKSASESSVRGM